MSIQRHNAARPCGVCGGHDKLPQSQGIRCFGFATDDGWIHCTRQGGGRAPYHESSTTWAHKAAGPCLCGTTHAEDPSAMPPPRARREPPAEVRELGEAKRAEIEATYDYADRSGALLFQVVRFKPKTFRQRRPHPDRPGEWVWHLTSCSDYRKQGKRCDCGLKAQPLTLYRIPEVIAGLEAGDTVWIVEGEKDVEAMRAAGCVATTNAGGAGKWNPAFAQLFVAHAQAGSAIRIVQDKDPETHGDGREHRKGQIHARAVYDSLRAALPETVGLSIVEAAEGKDPADHLAAGKTVEAFVSVFPIPEALLETDPAGFKRAALRAAITLRQSGVERASLDAPPQAPPRFRTPLRGDRYLSHFQGVVTIAGEPSAGKSYLAIGTAIENAMNPLEPWEVFYFAAEMGRDYFLDRSLRAAASLDLTFYECNSPDYRKRAVSDAPYVRLPAHYTFVDLQVGVTMNDIIEFLIANVGDRPTLVVIDSISSLVDNMEEVEGDSFGMTNIRSVQRYAIAVRNLTRGHVAFMILSEINKEGRAKGRSLDHRSDLAISMKKDPDAQGVKLIDVTKSWYCADGKLGQFALHPDIARLTKLAPDA